MKPTHNHRLHQVSQTSSLPNAGRRLVRVLGVCALLGGVWAATAQARPNALKDTTAQTASKAAPTPTSKLPNPTNHQPTQPAKARAQKSVKLNDAVVDAINTQASAPSPLPNGSATRYDVTGDDTEGSGDEMDGGDVDLSNVHVTDSNAPNIIPSASVPMDASVPDVGAAGEVALGAIAPTTVAKFVKVVDTIRQQYVRNTSDDGIFANAINGMLTGLDPYSEYLDAQAFDNLRLFTDGDVGSIGVTASFHPNDKMWILDEVLPNSPAARAGILRNFYLHQINDIKLSDEQTQQDIEQLLSGIAGSQVRLVVSDKGRRKQTVTVQRSLVQQQPIAAQWVDGVAVVHIPVFQNTTGQQLMAALANLPQPFSALVIDIRNNPGGVLSAASDVASLFMQDKPVAQVRKQQQLQEHVMTHGQMQFADMPLAIVQNRYSASAAEVLASSLQENARATVFGETSYGKGSIQSIVPLGDNTAVKLTVAHYYSGQGKTIDGVGVKPNIELQGAETDWQAQVLAWLKQQPPTKVYRVQLPNAPQQF